MSGLPATKIDRIQQQRRPNLTEIAPMLGDEFTIVATFLLAALFARK